MYINCQFPLFEGIFRKGIEMYLRMLLVKQAGMNLNSIPKLCPREAWKNYLFVPMKMLE